MGMVFARRDLKGDFVIGAVSIPVCLQKGYFVNPLSLQYLQADSSDYSPYISR